jgi:uncharacterized RDD family membrane protein YckC
VLFFGRCFMTDTFSSDQTWDYLLNGQPVGSFSKSQLIDLYRSQVLSVSTLIRQKGAENWQKFSDIFDLHLPPPVLGLVKPEIAEAIPTFSNFAHTEEAKTGSQDLAEAVGLSFEAKYPLTTPSSCTDTKPHPWRRYFARLIDGMVNGIFILSVLLIILYAINPIQGEKTSNYLATINPVVDSILTLFLAIWLNAALLGIVGTTLGKLIMGVQVRNMDGTKIGNTKALKRELIVWFKGLALGIPLFSLFTLWNGFDSLKKNGYTSWDHEMNLVVTYREESTKQTILTILGAAFLFFGMIGTRFL